MNSAIERNLRTHLETICLPYPSRHAGSPGEQAAADYIEGVFRELGLKTIREEYPVRGWEFRSESFVDETLGRPVPAFVTNYFSGSCDVRSDILIFDTEIPRDVDVRGRICFSHAMLGWAKAYNEIALELERRGAAAVIFISEGHCQASPSTKIVRSPRITKIATLSVAAEGAFFLTSHASDTFHLKVDATPFDTKTCNVIGRIEGTGTKKVVFGAHYDATPLTQGAGDDCSGTAMMLETARLFADYKGEYTLDFVAFSAEEYIDNVITPFPPGSGDYVARHITEDIRFMMNFDDYGQYFTEPHLQIGNAHKLPAGFELPEYTDAIGVGDDKAFMDNGIPTLGFYDKMLFRVLHTRHDTIETRDIPRMAEGVLMYEAITRRLMDVM